MGVEGGFYTASAVQCGSSSSSSAEVEEVLKLVRRSMFDRSAVENC